MVILSAPVAWRATEVRAQSEPPLPGNKEAIRLRYIEDEAAGRRNPAAKGGPDTDTTPVQTDPPREFGVASELDAPFPASEFVATNGWSGLVAGKLVFAYAGAVGDDPSQGAIAVVPLDSAASALSMHLTSSRVGALRILTASGTQLFAVSTSGASFVFDVSTKTFVSSPVLAGDTNGDGKVNCIDLSTVKASFGKRSGQPGFDVRADTNRDGLIDVRDLALVSRQLLPGTACSS